MSWPALAASVVVAFGLALWLTERIRRHALERQVLMDVPNARSSHTTITPRGGGVAIVVATLAVIVALALSGQLPTPVSWALLGGGGLIAAIGLVDDLGHIPASLRLIGHFAAAGWVLAWLGGVTPLHFAGYVLDAAWAGYVLGALYVVWMVNLTNFMDGIDGLAGLEMVTVCLGGALVQMVGRAGEGIPAAPLILAAAILGFLVLNWPPARIFMGDAGSGFLGLAVAALSIHAARGNPGQFWSWVILAGVFIVDATFTLIRRVIGGERFHEAHRSHAYQHAALRWRSHRKVTLAVGAINVFWLLPIALLVALDRLPGVAGVAVSYVPLVALASRLRAGREAHGTR